MPTELKVVLTIWMGVTVWFTIGGLLRGIHDAWSPPDTNKYSDGVDWNATIVGWPISLIYMCCAGAVLTGRAATNFIRSYFK